MPEFCVSRNPQPTGEHEVHAENCPAWPTDNVSLGWHRDCHGAVREARIYFPNVDGCAICSMQCMAVDRDPPHGAISTRQ